MGELDVAPIRAVIDTNVLFAGITQRGGAAGYILDAWLAGLFEACVSNALAYEYEDVLARLLSTERAKLLAPVLGALLRKSHFVAIHYSWRPTSPDPADEHIVDCAMNAGAVVVTENVRDFRQAQRELGLGVALPVDFVAVLANSGSDGDSE